MLSKSARPTRLIVSALCVSFFLFGESRLFAGLTFETETITLYPKLGEMQASARFVYKNTGSNPVTILNTAEDCGCTVARVKTITTAPGEGSDIEVVFDFGDRRGEQHKSVTIFTDSPESPKIKLTLNATILPVAEISHKLLSWPAGEAREPKTVRVDFRPELPLKLARFECSDYRYKIATRSSEDGKTLFLDVEPPEKQERGKERIDLIFESEDKRRFSEVIFLR